MHVFALEGGQVHLLQGGQLVVDLGRGSPHLLKLGATFFFFLAVVRRRGSSFSAGLAVELHGDVATGRLAQDAYVASAHLGGWGVRVGVRGEGGWRGMG